MRICCFADIHGNGPAFRQALTEMKREGADLYLFLGDLCGYYFDQAEIFERLMTLPNLVALRGNHDHIFLEILNGDEILRRDYLKKYGPSMERLLDKDCRDLARWLSDLPGSFAEVPGGIVAAHGSPWDPISGYVYPDTPLQPFLKENAEMFLLGHTHHSMEKRIEGKYIINPGSLGQPRNGGWPTYAVIEGHSRATQFREVPYGKDSLTADIERKAAGHPYLVEVLFR
jgi:predicted phosphodiesterase